MKRGDPYHKTPPAANDDAEITSRVAFVVFWSSAISWISIKDKSSIKRHRAAGKSANAYLPALAAAPTAKQCAAASSDLIDRG